MSRILFFAGIAVVLLAAAVGWQYMVVNPLGMHKQQGPSLEQQFEEVLNGFLNEVATEAQTYKTQRKVLSEMIKPENLRDPAYVTENYQMMQNLLPDLYTQMDAVMAVFGQTDKKITALLEKQPEEEQAVILEKWAGLKEKQAGTYIAFFEVEGEILQAYEALMAVYYDTQGRFSVDMAKNEIVFEQIEDELRAQEKRIKLKHLMRQQAKILAQGA